MTELSRRNFLTGAAGAAAALAATGLPAQTGRPAPVLNVQFTTGSHTVPLAQYEMWEEPLFSDLNVWCRPWPNPFAKISEPGGPDVIVLDDWNPNGWPQEDRDAFMKWLDTDKGTLLLHHATNDNEKWDFFVKEVSGCLTLQDITDPKRKVAGRLEQFPKQTLSPVGSHPILKGVEPFVLPWDEIYQNMEFAPGITPLINTSNSDSLSPVVGWIGPYKKGRVVCFEPGHTAEATADPRFQHIVHNMVLWAGKKLV
jgi:hypothetical protein